MLTHSGGLLSIVRLPLWAFQALDTLQAEKARPLQLPASENKLRPFNDR